MGELASSRGPTVSSIDAGFGERAEPLKGGDVYKWAMDQTALIRAGRYEEIDWINVADEIESVGTTEFRSLSSHPGLARETFPPICPYDWDMIMMQSFVLDQTDETS